MHTFPRLWRTGGHHEQQEAESKKERNQQARVLYLGKDTLADQKGRTQLGKSCAEDRPDPHRDVQVLPVWALSSHVLDNEDRTASAARRHGEHLKEEVMETVYMVCDYTDVKASGITGTPHVGVEYMGNCGGRILREDGTEIGRHHSSSFGWLRSDLRGKLDDPNKYKIIDLIGQPVPERFK